MRVLEVITGGEPGGAQRHVVELSRHLQDHGHEVMILHGGGRWLTQTLGPSFPARYVSSLVRSIRPGSDRRALKELEHEVARYRPSVMHVHSSKAGILGRFVAWRRHTPAVYTAHGYVFEDPTISRLGRTLYRRLEGWASTHSAATIVVARQDLAFATRHTRGGNAFYVPNGVILAPSARHPKRVPPIVGFMGRFSREKGLDWVIPTAVQHPEYIWHFAGDGALRSLITDQVRHHAHLRWDGWVDVLDDWFGEVDVLIQPSWKEGAPYTLLDALARGVVTVGSRVGGIPELLTGIDPALLVTPGDSDDLIRGIRYALEHGDRLRESMYRQLREHFDRDTQLQKVEDILLEVARS